MAFVDRVGASVLSSLEFVGELATFGGRAIVDALRPPYEVGEIAQQGTARCATTSSGSSKLNPQAVGVMPLGSDSAGSPKNVPWDGVALAAFIDRRALTTPL